MPSTRQANNFIFCIVPSIDAKVCSQKMSWKLHMGWLRCSNADQSSANTEMMDANVAQLGVRYICRSEQLLCFSCDSPATVAIRLERIFIDVHSIGQHINQNNPLD